MQAAHGFAPDRPGGSDWVLLNPSDSIEPPSASSAASAPPLDLSRLIPSASEMSSIPSELLQRSTLVLGPQASEMSFPSPLPISPDGLPITHMDLSSLPNIEIDSLASAPLPAGSKRPLISAQQQRRAPVKRARTRQGRDSTPFHSRITALQRYVAEKGAANVPFSWSGPREGEHGLGRWVAEQRKARRAGLLSIDIVNQLTMLGFVWTPPTKPAPSWNTRLSALKAFIEEHGHCQVPFKYSAACDGGSSLGRWVQRQRTRKKHGEMTEEQERSLNQLGFAWEFPNVAWSVRVEALKRYKSIHGHIAVPGSYSGDGEGEHNLGGWVQRQRKRQTAGLLEPSRKAELDGLGFIWTFSAVDDTAWHDRISALRAYKLAHGTMCVPSSWSGVGLGEAGLGKWVSLQRKRRKKGLLSTAQLAELDALDFPWESNRYTSWEYRIEALKKWVAEHGHCRVPQTWSGTGTGENNLGIWVDWQRRKLKKGNLSENHQRQLNELGFLWRVHPVARIDWLERLAALKRFKQEYGHLWVPMKWSGTGEGEHNLGTWANNQRSKRKMGLLKEQEINDLESIGFQWRMSRANGRQSHVTWDERIEALERYRAAMGHTRVPVSWTGDGVGEHKLGTWVAGQRQRYKAGKLDKAREQQLEAIGFVWNAKGGPAALKWKDRIEALRKFKENHGDLRVPTKFTGDGPGEYNLGGWVRNQRHARKTGRLSAHEVEELNSLGFLWQLRKRMESSIPVPQMAHTMVPSVENIQQRTSLVHATTATTVMNAPHTVMDAPHAVTGATSPSPSTPASTNGAHLSGGGLVPEHVLDQAFSIIPPFTALSAHIPTAATSGAMAPEPLDGIPSEASNAPSLSQTLVAPSHHVPTGIATTAWTAEPMYPTEQREAQVHTDGPSVPTFPSL